MKEKPTTGEKFLAAFMAVFLTIMGFFGFLVVIDILWAIWSAGFFNFLFWMSMFVVIGLISSGVYRHIIRKDWMTDL